MNHIENVRLKFACSVNWDSMDVLAGAKHCSHCQKKVYDFTNAKQDEFLKILAENHNNVCGRFRTDQAIVNPVISSSWKKLLTAAMVLVGINAFNHKAEAQNTKLTPKKISTASPEIDVVMGEPMPIDAKNNKNQPIQNWDVSATFPGGINRFSKLVLSNLKRKEGMENGRVFIQFDISRKGELTNFQIIRGLNALNNEEALRVLKRSPKWKPAMLQGKPVASNYTVLINFGI